MGLFDGIKDATINRGGIYILPLENVINGKAGHYLLRINSLVTKESRKKESLFIGEFGILESDVPSRAPGTDVSWLANLTKHEAALGNVKGLLAASAKIEEEEVDSAGADAATGEDQPFAGWLVRCEAFCIETREKKPFTKVVWSRATDTDEAKYKAAA